MRLVLIGPPGVGKGTQGARLSETLGVPSVSTGALLRQLIASGEDTPRVQEARGIEQGAFVSDTFANALAFDALRAPAAARGFVLDGYPRSVPQARALDHFLEERGELLDAVLVFVISTTALAERVLGRRVCLVCGATYHLTAAPPRDAARCDRCGGSLQRRVEDNEPEKIRLRQALYETRTAPLIDYYAQQGRVRRISAEGSPAVVFGEICKALEILI